MDWKPVEGVQLLEPFDHQVAGQSSMLKYDATTVCKPLIAREHFVYKTLPDELKTFTPEYRGEIEVQLSEQDGYIQLLGLPVNEDSASVSCSCSSNHDVTSHAHPVLASAVANNEVDSSTQNRCMIRVLRSGSYEFNSTTNEVFCAEDSNSSKTQKLNPWSLKNHKRLLDKLRKSEHTHNKIHFMLLRNVVADFKHPCILDLKIGSRLHGDDASQMKVASQLKKCKETTSSTLGLRLCGMQVYHIPSGVYHSVDKFHGRTLNDQSFKQILYNFLHNSFQFRRELVRPIVDRLSQLAGCLKTLDSYRFYASSLLIIYDGDLGPEGKIQEESSDGVTVSNSTHHPHFTNSHSASASASHSVSELPEKQTLTDLDSAVNLEVDKPSNKCQAEMYNLLHSPLNVPPTQLTLSHPDHITHEQNTFSLNMVNSVTKNCVSLKNIPSGIQLDDQNRDRKENSYSSAEIKTDQQKSAVILESLMETSNSGRTQQSVDTVASHVSSITENMESTSGHQVDQTQSKIGNKLTQCAHKTQNETYSVDTLEPDICVQCTSSTVKFDVKMIDFAHTTHRGFVSDKITHSGPDTDYIRGLENLIKLFVQLLDEA